LDDAVTGGTCLQAANCIAEPVWLCKALQKREPPSSSALSGDGEFEFGASLGVAEDGGAREQSPAQVDQFGA
jgi:hypothetical protein